MLKRTRPRRQHKGGQCVAGVQRHRYRRRSGAIRLASRNVMKTTGARPQGSLVTISAVVSRPRSPGGEAPPCLVWRRWRRWRRDVHMCTPSIAAATVARAFQLGEARATCLAHSFAHMLSDCTFFLKLYYVLPLSSISASPSSSRSTSLG